MTDQDRKPFSIEEFTKDAKLSQKTITYLSEENIEDDIVLEQLDPTRISVSAISEGDQVCLQIACDKVFKRTVSQEIGAIGGLSIIQESSVLPEASDRAVETAGSSKSYTANPAAIVGPEKSNIATLAKDAELNALLREFLGSNQGLSSFIDLLTLNDINAAVEKKG